MPTRAQLPDPDDDPGDREEHQERAADSRERETSSESIDDVHDAIRVIPPRDVPHDEFAEQERQPRQGIAHRASRRQLLVDGRPLLAEESIGAECRCDASEPVEGEGAIQLEMRDQDVLGGPLAVHQVDETKVLRFEAYVQARSALTTGILQHVIGAPVAAAELGALDVRHKPRLERRVIEPLPQRCPDAFHPRAAR